MKWNGVNVGARSVEGFDVIFKCLPFVECRPHAVNFYKSFVDQAASLLICRKVNTKSQ